MASERKQYSSPLQQERQQRILEAARAVLATNGVASLTMKGVAELSGVSLKTVYNIYRNRDGLLLRVAVQLLGELESLAADIEPESGIQQLLAYSENGFQMIRDDPDLYAITLKILFQAEGEDLASSQISRLRTLVRSSLVNAIVHGELIEGIDIDELSDVITSNQWGLALMWEKGFLPTEELGHRVLLSHCLTLIPVCQGTRKLWLEEKVNDFLRLSAKKTEA